MAAGVLTVSATATRMTAAIVAPTCGIRSSSPVISASTIGNGRPSAHADTPATVPATKEIAMLPISEEETARIESSTTGPPARLDRRRREAEEPVGDGRALHQQEEREEGERHQRQHGAEHAAGGAQQRVRRVGQARARSLSALRDRLVGARVRR